MILFSAIKVTVNGNKSVVPGYRHSDCYELLSKLHVVYFAGDVTEGFIDNKGNFLDRYDAFEHAVNCGQLSRTTLDHKEAHFEVQLYSEDLY